MTFTFEPEIWFKVTTKPLPESSIYVKDKHDRAKSRENMIMMFWEFFLMQSNMTLTLDLETLFKVTAYPLTEGALLLKYEPYGTQGRDYMI